MDSGLWKWKADCTSYSVGGYFTFHTSGFYKQLLLQCNAVIVLSIQLCPDQWPFFFSIVYAIAWVKTFCLKSHNSEMWNVQSKTQNRSIHTGSGSRVCLPSRLANVRCLEKRGIKQAYTVFFFLPYYSTCFPNSCAWGIYFTISSMCFSSKNSKKRSFFEFLWI